MARRLRLSVIAWLCVASVCVAWGAASAGASTTHLLIGSFMGEGTPAGSFGDPNGIAVDESTGDVYVVDIANRVVDRFDASGNAVDFASLGSSALSGAATPAGSFAFPGGEIYGTPDGVAVDNDPLSPSYGDLYVVDAGHGVVDRFTSAGAYSGQLTGTPGGPFDTEGQFGAALALAVDTTGNVWVYEANGEVDKFDSSGVFVSQFATGCEASLPGLAVDSNDDVYASCGGVIDEFGPTGIALGSLPSSNLSLIGVDPANNDVFVLQERYQVQEFDSSGTLVSSFRIPSEGNTGGIAVNGTSGDVYLAGGESRTVYHWGPLVTLPDVTTEPASGVQPTGATLNGTVNPNGVQVTTCRFEYGAATTYGQSAPCTPEPGSGTAAVAVNATLSGLPADSTYHFRVVAANGDGILQYGQDETFTTTGSPSVDEESAGEIKQTGATFSAQIDPHGFDTTYHFEYGTTSAYGTSLPIADADIGSGTSDVAVSVEPTGLQSGVSYHYRVVAVNSAGTTDGPDEAFTTTAPALIENLAITDVTSAGAIVHAQINPLGSDTTYHIEYGTNTAYGANVPTPDADVGSGTSAQPITQKLSGLSANVTYHVRVVAQNALGTVHGADHTFRYDTSGEGLPDNRVYEMVTPPHKNGALINDVSTSILAPAISPDGSRVIAPSIQCFAGATSCNAMREDSIGSAYSFTRTGGGWVTTSLEPSATQAPASSPMLYSPETGAALFEFLASGGDNAFYAREPDGSFTDIGPPAPPVVPGSLSLVEEDYRNAIDATSDLSHVVWETNPQFGHWPFDATRHGLSETDGYSVYEYVGAGNSQPALVGVSGGPGSTDLISVCGTHLGNGSTHNIGELSKDGETVFFTARPCASGSGTNAHTPVPADELYARIDGSRTVAISQHSSGDCTGICQQSSPSNAEFVGASEDGSKALFLSTQQLTNEASEDGQDISQDGAGTSCDLTSAKGGCDLYEYDLASPTGHQLIDVSAGDTSGDGPQVQGVMALSADGSHVYFVAKGVLTDATNSQGQGAQEGADNLYVFERDTTYPAGHLEFIATLPAFDQTEWTQNGESKANVTPNGRFLVFTSSGQLTADDMSVGHAQQVFRFDAQTGELVRISIGNEGFNDNGNLSTNSPCLPSGCSEDATIAEKLTGLGVRKDLTMSDDGSYVFFQSPVALTPRALDNVPIGVVEGLPAYAQNVYEYHDGHVYLISDGRDATRNAGSPGNIACEKGSSVCLLGTDASGADVFFTTADPLVEQDTDTELDIYDARICAAGEPCVGLSAQSTPCEGEACHGAAASAPVLEEPASAALTGTGNLSPQAKPAVKPKKKAKPKTVKKGRHPKVRRAQRAGKHVKRGRK